ncbi:hypothetical protein B0T24DRAFT_679946 [Lasiosphaeria ovina]|uniref:Uncharacterized protein n=1 Tax=Lasiosphaeria ovina TaxID=92902 RepID=A0AAE0K6Y4_9PEZI|nr:hypothetical protein B0T24DRAFT_679946 [Lasiosphaeria ovina]
MSKTRFSFGSRSASLRVNKQMNEDATPTLYGGNRFHIPDINTSLFEIRKMRYTGLLTQLLGANARLDLHMVELVNHLGDYFGKVNLRDFGYLRLPLRDAVGALDRDAFKDMRSLQKIVVTQWCAEEDDEFKHVRDMLVEELPSAKWLPTEIRFNIYPELLVHDGTIKFVVDLVRVKREVLSPAILCANKAINQEAAPFLYADNCFKFPCGFIPMSVRSNGFPVFLDLYIAPFLRRIGANAALVRHIEINFPNRLTYHNLSYDQNAEVLQLVQQTCPSLKTVKIWCTPYTGISGPDDDAVPEKLKELDDKPFKAFVSLEKVVVVFRLFRVVHARDRANLDDLMLKMPSSKWSTELFTFGQTR